MSKWSFTKNKVRTLDPIFDDGLVAFPGDEDFDKTAVTAQMTTLGADGFDYVGVSDIVQQ